MTSKIGLQKTDFYLGLTLFSSSHFLTLMKQAAMLWDDLWQGPHGKELKTLVQQPMRNWILPMTLWVNLEVSPLPVEPSDETAAQSIFWL